MSDVPLDQRPRERLALLGAAALTDAELVSVLLGSGRRGASATDLAAELLAAHGGVAGLASAGLDDLAAHPGMGPVKAARVLAGVALGSSDRAPDPRAILDGAGA